MASFCEAIDLECGTLYNLSSNNDEVHLLDLLINGKGFLEWTADDLQVIINNYDYSENDNIDYKKTFAFFEAKTPDDKKQKIAEFRHDVCSFANSSGGFLFIGISEERGIPTEINGIDIHNADTDKSEQDLRNKLTGIQPAIPTISIKHIPLTNGQFVIVIRIHEGVHIPYVFMEKESLYKFCIRRGNGKKEMSYTEIRDAFTRALTLSDSIQRFRDARHSFFAERFSEKTEPAPRYMLMHIVPESITDVSSHRKLYTMRRDKGYHVSSAFPRFCGGICFPNVDGVEYIQPRFPNGLGVSFFNNGAAEFFTDLYNEEYSGESSNIDGHIIYVRQVWYNMKEFIQNYINARERFTYSKRLYLAFSVIGCKGCVSEIDDFKSRSSRIDRNRVINTPIQLDNAPNEEAVSEAIENFSDDFFLSLGFRDLSTKDIQ